MKRYLVFIFLSILFLGCQSIDKPEKPLDLIDKATMIDVLVDTYLSNATRSKTYQEIREENVRLEKYIYQKYNIDSLQFAKSNAYYTSDLDSYSEMLLKVEEKLSALKVEVEGSEEEEEIVPLPVDDLGSEEEEAEL